MATKQGKAESGALPILTALNAMKLTIAILVMVIFVALAGSPKPTSDAMDLPHLPDVTETAYAQTPPKASQTAPKPEVIPAVVFDPAKPETYPKCAENQIVWAQDGQCHDKVVQPTAPVATAVPAAASTQAAGDCSNQEALHGMEYVFCHESTYRPAVYNSEGCVGLGQACPASKLLKVCPDLAVSCQISWFTDYANQRYGGWAGAETFWRSHRWW